MTNDILILINDLPIEIKNNIYFFIPIRIKTFLTKENYTHFYYKTIYSKIRNHITYSRKLISMNLFISFEVYIFYSTKLLKKKTKIRYKDIKYNNYYDFLNKMCIEYQSTICRNVLNKYYNC